MDRRILKSAMALWLVVWLGWDGVIAARWMMNAKDDAQGFASTEYRDSKLIERVKSYRPNTIIYTNMPWPVEFYTGRLTKSIPAKHFRGEQENTPLYRGNMGQMAREVERGAIVVYFKDVDSYSIYPAALEIRESIFLTCVAEEQDGYIFETDFSKGSR